MMFFNLESSSVKRKIARGEGIGSDQVQKKRAIDNVAQFSNLLTDCGSPLFLSLSVCASISPYIEATPTCSKETSLRCQNGLSLTH